jgi:O-antigen/teichoic acid export membrane protein
MDGLKKYLQDDIMNLALANRIIWDRIFRLRSEALWVFIGQTGTALGGLFGVKILTHVLSPLEFGRLALANTVVLLIGTSLFGPLGQGVMRFWSISQDRGQIESFISTLKHYTTFMIYIVLIISLVLSIFSALTQGIDWTVLLMISLIVGALTGWSGVRIYVLMAARKRKIVALVNTGTAFFKPLIATFFVIALISNAGCVMAGYLLTACVIVYVVEYFYGKTVTDTLRSSPAIGIGDSKEKSSQLGREIFTFSWPFFVWGIFGWIHQSCDRWSLQAYHGADVVGAFSVITQLAVYPLIFGSGFLGTLFIPIAYDRAGDLYSYDSIESANKILFAMTSIYIIGASILIVLFGIFHHLLALLISNVSFVRFSYLLPGLTTSWALFYLGQMLCGFGLLANKPRIYVIPILASGMLATITTFYLSARIGPVGVVWGLGISGSVYALWNMIIAVRLSNSFSKTGRYVRGNLRL